MKIYTKVGDQGTTYLFGGGPFPKDIKRVEAYGNVDEVNSVLGCVISEIGDANLISEIISIQKQLFIVGAELASLNPNEKMRAGFIQMSHVTHLEKLIDGFEASLAPLTQFILPGGSKPAALLHLARVVCRRTERSVVALSHEEPIRSEILIYLNRLSDLLFMMARFVNLQSKVDDIFWEGILKKE